jgi:hypothetical protein
MPHLVIAVFLSALMLGCMPIPPNELIGKWTEQVQFACGTNEEIVPNELLKELIIESHTFQATWHPFENYVDVRGSYKTTGSRIEFLPDLNHFATGATPTGTFSFDAQSRLILSDMWLGAGPSRIDARACGHRFARVK